MLPHGEGVLNTLESMNIQSSNDGRSSSSGSSSGSSRGKLTGKLSSFWNLLKLDITSAYDMKTNAYSSSSSSSSNNNNNSSSSRKDVKFGRVINWDGTTSPIIHQIHHFKQELYGLAMQMASSSSSSSIKMSNDIKSDFAWHALWATHDLLTH